MVGKMEAHENYLKEVDRAVKALSSQLGRNPKCGAGRRKRSTKYNHPLKSHKHTHDA